jgi:hypothetical protein
MASWGCLLAIQGFIYDGPAARIGFAPRLTPDDFQSFFTAAEGWGTLSQKRQPNKQINRFDVEWGRVRVQTFAFQLPSDAKSLSAKVTLANREIPAQLKQVGLNITLLLSEPITATPNQPIEVTLTW